MFQAKSISAGFILHLVYVGLIFLCTVGLAVSAKGGIERSIEIMNKSGHKVEIYWVHAGTGELVLQSSPHVFNGATFTLNSFVGHSFQARELPGKSSGVCKNQECLTGYFTVNDNFDQVFTINEDLVIDSADNKSRAREDASKVLSMCKKKAYAHVESMDIFDSDSAGDLIQQMAECVQANVAEEMEKANEEVAFQAQIRTRMGGLLENYTCADEILNTTEPESTHKWRNRGKNYHVDVMLDRPRSKIHLVENFITETECEAVEKAAKKKLHKATVADNSGGSQLSDNRKAMQAGLKVHWDREKRGDHIAKVSRRVLDFTNSVTNFDLKEHGQEDLMSIQYSGRGRDDPAPDRYMPHCDGDCTGMPHKPGTRVATMVMYCEVPEVGGATNFRNAGVHIEPKKGSAVFFSYMGDDFVMDKGFTEHSGCPVLIGEKKIVTQWMRHGVDAENPWDSFNTLGIKIDLEDD